MLHVSLTISRRAAFVIVLSVLLVIPLVALAGSVFDDVDDTNVHIDGITFVKDSGVSVGCDASNNYCPSDFVTREQMATFMYRLSGTDPATAASVFAADSDEVDGYHANELVRFAGDRDEGTALSGVDGIAASVDITAPVRGFLVISASSSIEAGSANELTCYISVNGTISPASARRTTVAASEFGICSTDTYHTVLFPGDYTVEFEYSDISATTFVYETVLNVRFVPFDGNGISPGFVIVPLDD